MTPGWEVRVEVQDAEASHLEATICNRIAGQRVGLGDEIAITVDDDRADGGVDAIVDGVPVKAWIPEWGPPGEYRVYVTSILQDHVRGTAVAIPAVEEGEPSKIITAEVKGAVNLGKGWEDSAPTGTDATESPRVG